MRAVLVDRFGGPEVLTIRDIPSPQPRAHEVLIKVAAASINFGDLVVRSGGAPIALALPFVPGNEVAGEIAAIGDAVRDIEPGARVLAPLFLAGRLDGGYAEYVTLDADLVFPIPPTIDFDAAIALSLQGITARLLLDQVDVQARTVLIHAAAGGVGSLLIQLARHRGARMILGTAGSDDKLALVRRLGADAVVNYRKSDWTDQLRSATDNIDLILESVGGDVRRKSLELLAPLGTLLAYGGSATGGYFGDPLDATQVGGLMVRNQIFRGFSMWPLLPDRAHVRKLISEVLTELFDLVTAGTLQPIIGGAYPLERAMDAHCALAERKTTGKLVLHPRSAQ